MTECIAVIGSGPAGSVTAFVLARAGVSVHLIDPSAFPRDKACGDVIGSESVRSLKALGLGHVLQLADRAASQRFVDTTDRTIEHLSVDSGSTQGPFVIPRLVFDAALRDAAIDAGAIPLQAKFTKFGHTFSHGRTVVLSYPDGSERTATYAFVVGADGARSKVARAAGLHSGLDAAHAVALRRYVRSPPEVSPELLFFEPTWQPLPNTGPTYHWAFPVAADRLNIGVYTCSPSGGQKMATQLHDLQQRLGRFLGDGRPLSPNGPTLGGIVRYDFDPALVTGDRVALVGDAAGLSDAVLGEGIYYAIRSGQLIAETLIDTGLSNAAERMIAEQMDAAFTSVVSTTRDAARHRVSLFLRTPSIRRARFTAPVQQRNLGRRTLLARVAKQIVSGDTPWATPPPSIPRLLPGTLGTAEALATSIGRAGRWWGDWIGARVSPIHGLTLAPFRDNGGLATVSGKATLVLEDLQLAMCADIGGSTTVGQLVKELRDEGLPSRLPAEVFVTNVLQALAEARMVRLVPEPAQMPPPIDAYVSQIRTPRNIPLVPGTMRRGKDLPSKSTGRYRFQLQRRPMERLAGYLDFQTSDGVVTVAIHTDMAEIEDWCNRLGLARQMSSAESADRVLRVLTVPGDTERSVVLLDDEPHGLVRRVDAIAELSAVLISAIRTDPPGTNRVRPCWVSLEHYGWRLCPETPGTHIPQEWMWNQRLWVGDDGAHVSVLDGPATRDWIETHDLSVSDPSVLATWSTHPLVSITPSDKSTDLGVRAAAIVDALRIGVDPELGQLCKLGVRLAESGRLVALDRARPDPPIPASICAFADVGSLTVLGTSMKLEQSGVRPDRVTWWFHINDNDDARTAATRKFVEFGLHDHVASALAEMENPDSKFILGAEPGLYGTLERRKVYAPVTTMNAWADLVNRMPELAQLHETSSISDRTAEGQPPCFVAWKFEDGSTGTSTAVYRRLHNTDLTVAEAIERVVPGATDWAVTVRELISLDRDCDTELHDGDLEVIEDNGRSSIDLEIEVPSPSGERIARASWLAALQGVSARDAHRWADEVARAPISRIIVGTDSEGQPFCSVYFHR